MGCIVEKVKTKSGEESKLFIGLTKSMSEADALYAYITAEGSPKATETLYGKNDQGEANAKKMISTPKFRLAEFTDVQEETDVIDFLAETMVDILKKDAGLVSETSVAGINTSALAEDPSAVTNAVTRTKEYLGKALSNPGLVGRQRQLVRVALKNIDSYLITEDDAGPTKKLGVLGKKLQDYGIPLSISEKGYVEKMQEDMTEINEDIDSEDLAIKYERIYDLDVMETSPVNTVLDGVRMYLGSKRKVAQGFVYKPGKTIDYEKSLIGHNRPADAINTTALLFTKLSGIQTVEDMIQRLQDSVVNAPELAPVLEDLLAEQEAGGTKTKVGSKTISYKPLSAALFSTFAKHNYDMFTVVEQGNGTVVFMDANRASVGTGLKTEWAGIVEDMQELPKNVLDKKLAFAKAINPSTGIKGLTTKEKAEKLIQVQNLNKPVIKGKFLKQLNKVFAPIYGTTVEDLAAIQTIVKKNPKRFSTGKGSKRRAMPFSAVMSEAVNALVVKPYSGSNIFTNTESTKSESKYLNLFAEAKGQRISDVMLGSFLSGRNTVVHPLNQASEANDIINRLKGQKGEVSEFYTMLKEDVMYKDSILLNKAMESEHIGRFKIRAMDVLNDNTSTKAGVQYGSLSTFDANVTRINAYLESAQEGYFMAFSPTQADRGKLQTLTVPKLNYKNGFDEAVFDKNGVMKESEIRDWVKNQVTAEINRIITSKKQKSGTSNYKNYTHSNAERFNLFPILNDTITDITTRNKRAKIEEAMAIMDSEFNNIIQGDKSFLIETGVLQKKGNGLEYTKQALKAVGINRGSLRVTQASVDNFLANNFIYTYEQTMLYAGDMAYYSDASIAKQKVNLNKRLGLPFTPGTKLAVGDTHGIPAETNIIIMKEPKMKSQLASLYRELGNVTANEYNNIEVADGVGFVSLERYGQLLIAQGIESDAALQVINKLENLKPGKDAMANLEVLKGFYFRLQKGKHGAVVPFNLKYSIVPAIPAFFEAMEGGKAKYAGLDKISKRLRAVEKPGRPKIGEIVMETAVKVGASDMSTIDNLETAKYTTIHNESYRFPQPSPTKHSVEDTFGSQMRKIITGNFQESHSLNFGEDSIGGTRARELYEEAISSLAEQGGREVYDNYLNGEDVKTEEIIEQLLNDVENNNFANAEYFQQALEVMETDGTVLPLNYPTLSFKVDNIINANFKNKVTRLKLPGYSAVQMPSMGTTSAITKSKISTDSDLKFVRIADMNGSPLSGQALVNATKLIIAGEDTSGKYKVLPAEVRVTPKFFVDNIKKKVAQQVKKSLSLKLDKEMVATEKSLRKIWRAASPNDLERIVARESSKIRSMKLHKATQIAITKTLDSMRDSKGNYSIKKIHDAGLDEMVLYRIPTQAKNSMLPVIIKEFVREELGGTAQVPAEIVDQSGSDFDIDKIHIEMNDFSLDQSGNMTKHTYKDAEGNYEVKSKSQAKAYIVDFHKAVLKSPSYAQELLSTNNTKQLIDIAEDFGFSDENLVTAFPSMRTQEILRSDNQAGKDMISITSVASSAHITAKHLGVRFNETFTIANEPVQLGERNNIEGDFLISQDIEQLQNAALDNANDPLLGKLNINTFTAGVVSLLTSAGHGLRYSLAMVNSPIVRDLAQVYPKYARKNTASKALDLSIAEVLTKGERNIKISEDELVDYTTYRTESSDKVIQAMSDRSKSAEIKHLANFLALRKIGDTLTEFQLATNFDSKGTPASFSRLRDRYESLAKIKGTAINARETGVEALEVMSRIEVRKKLANKDSFMERNDIGRTADEKFYINKKTGETYERLSTKLKLNEGIDSTDPLIKSASEIGTALDNTVRDFFAESVFNKPVGMSTEVAMAFQTQLKELKAYFVKNREKVITDKKSLLLVDTKLKVAGEMDLITVDNKGHLRIYDMKTVRKSKPSEYSSVKAGKKYIAQRNEKHRKQLNGYMTLLRNTTDIEAVSLNIIPIKVAYEAGDTMTTEVKFLDFVPHAKDHSILADSRGLAPIKEQKILSALGITLDKMSDISVDPAMWAKHSMGTFEKQAIIAPMEVNRKVSPNASVLSQNILKQASQKIGRLTENQEATLLADMYTYMATNKKASNKYESGASKMTPNDIYEMSGTSDKALHNRIKKYRDRVKLNGGTENMFVSKLKFIDEGGRTYVTFNNTTAKAMHGDMKRQLMYAFEDLYNDAGDSQTKALAQSLADYALTHYGFAKSVNSFMELIPPAAHRKFMGNQQGLSLPDMFDDMTADMDSVGEFAGVTSDFVDLYVANNSHKLPIMKLFPKSTQTLFKLKSRLNPPGYVSVVDSKGETLYRYDSGTAAYVVLKKRGVKNLVSDYGVESRYEEVTDETGMYMDLTKDEILEDYSQKTGKVKGPSNKKEVAKLTTNENVFGTVYYNKLKDAFNGPIKNKEDATKFLETMAADIRSIETVIGKSNAENLIQDLGIVAKNTLYTLRKKANKVPAGDTFESTFMARVEKLLTNNEEGIPSYKDSAKITKELLNC